MISRQSMGPSAGNSNTSVITTTDTVIFLPLTIDWLFCKFYKNSMAIVSLGF